MNTKKLPLETDRLVFLKNSVIPPTNGSDDFYERDFPLGQELFRWIDPDFNKWDLIPVEKNTDLMNVAIYKQTKSGILKDTLESLGRYLPMMSLLTHQQIKAFVSANLYLLENPHSSIHFIYLDETEGLFVVTVSGDIEEGLDMYLRKIDSNTPWKEIDGNFYVIRLLKKDFKRK